MEAAYNVASKRPSRKKEQDVKRHQRKILSHAILQPGDRVLMLNLLEIGYYHLKYRLFQHSEECTFSNLHLGITIIVWT